MSILKQSQIGQVFGLNEVLTQHINNVDLKTYFLHFSPQGNKFQKLMDILFEALVEFYWGIEEKDKLSSMDKDRFRDACDMLYGQKEDLESSGLPIKDNVGELILHAILRDYFFTIPLTGKLHFINNTNMAPKGFDTVHLKIDDLNAKTYLVLGENKLYGVFKERGVSITNSRIAKKAVNELIEDISKHFLADYMRHQFMFIEGKTNSKNEEIQSQIINPTIERLKEWKNKLREKNSSNRIDEIADDIIIPIMCTYTNDIYANHNEISQDFLNEYESQINDIFAYYQNKHKEKNIRSSLNIILILFPIPDKEVLIKEYCSRLKKGFNN